jgi:hypothetical protein
MKCRRFAALPFLFAASSILGCGQPAHPPPEGYVESCYGGDFKKYHDGNGPRLSIRFPLTESQWPDLSESLRQFSAQQHLDFFDTGLRLDYAHVLELSVCSANGVLIYAADDVWKGKPDFDPGYTTVVLYTFKNYDARAIGDALVVHLQNGFPDATARRTDAKGAPEQ